MKILDTIQIFEMSEFSFLGQMYKSNMNRDMDLNFKFDNEI